MAPAASLDSPNPSTRRITPISDFISRGIDSRGWPPSMDCSSAGGFGNGAKAISAACSENLMRERLQAGQIVVFQKAGYLADPAEKRGHKYAF